MQKRIYCFVLSLVVGCVFPMVLAQDLPDSIADAVADPARMSEHRQRDVARMPEKVLATIGFEPGLTVTELAPGAGYYAALLSRVIGNTGRLYAVDPARLFIHFPTAMESFPKFMVNDPRENIHYSRQKFDQLSLPEQQDIIFMPLYLHDTLWTGEDVDFMLQRIYRLLKPGGTFAILEHDAKPELSLEDYRTLHRMPEHVVQPLVTGAGFKFIAAHDFLKNDIDPLDTHVFDEKWRGKTSRFLHIYQKTGNDLP